jgi:hypothetical protein
MSLRHPAGGNPPPRTSQKQTSLSCFPSLSVPVFLKDFPIMVSNQQLLANFGLVVILPLGVLSAPSLQAETEPRVYSGMPYTTLGETRSLSSPTHQYPLLPEAMTPEWRFCMAHSVPVPLSGSNLKAHLIINPAGMCPVTRLCSLFPTEDVR